MKFRSYYTVFFYLVFTVFLSSSAQAALIKNIVIKGNKIVSTEAIQAKIYSQVKKTYKVQQVRKDVQQIFDTGWFESVEVELNKHQSGSVILIYKVVEQPIVEKIVYKGNRKLSKKELDDLFYFSEYEFLNHKKIQKSIQAVQKEYEKKGYYLAELSYSLKKVSKPDRVQLVVEINENKKVKVKRVQFIGNDSIASKELKTFMSTKEPNLLSFLSGAGSYSAENLEKDIGNIKYIYLDRGYWQVYVDKPKVFISPDQTEIFITISIKEGKQYKVGSMNFSGDLVFNTDYLKEGMETAEEEIFSYGKMQRDIKRIETKYGDKGYAFVNVVPRFFNDQSANDLIHVLFEIQKGKEVSIRQVHISGNDYTRDKVIRREMRIFEGDLYNTTKKDQSAANIQRLGFFGEVNILPKTLSQRDDLVDMEVSVKERETTGVLEGGIGYNGYMGFEIRGKVHKTNLFGRGYDIGLDVNLSQMRQNISLSFSDPYFLDSKWHLGTEFYIDYWDDTPSVLVGECEEYKKVKEKYEKIEKDRSSLLGNVKNWFTGGKESSENTEKQEELLRAKRACFYRSRSRSNYRGFATQIANVGLTLGRSVTDYLKLLLYYRIERVTLFNTIDSTLFPVEDASGVRDPLEGIIEYDRRNDRMFPTAGIYSRGSITYTGILGKFDYFTFSGNFRWYQELFWKLVFRVNVQYSRHFSLSGSLEDNMPFDRLFTLGGINSLRGFDYFSIGPRRVSQKMLNEARELQAMGDNINPEYSANYVYGGYQEFYTNLEIQFPILQAMRLMGVVFVDVGRVFDNFSDMTGGAQLRGNWGAGLRLITPVGPMRLEMGFPFQPKSEWGEESSNFNFTMGFSF